MIGLRDNHQTGSRIGSLVDHGIRYSQIELRIEDDPIRRQLEPNRRHVWIDLEEMDRQLEADPTIKLIHVQR